MMNKYGIIYIGNFLIDSGFTPQPIESLKYLFEKNYNFYYASKKKSKFWRFIDFIWTFIKYRGKSKVLIIDVYSGLAYYYALSISLLSKIFNLKYVLVIHGGNFESRLKNNENLTQIMLSSAAKIISPSSFMHTILNKYGYNSLIISNPIDLTLYKFKKRKEIAPKILWVRSFHKFYNPELAVDIVKELHKRGIPAEMTMVGPAKDNSFDKVIKKIEQESLSEYIKLTGKLGKVEWLNLADQYDIFINTTNFDNMPISVLEGMAKGLVVISTNVGGLPFIIKDGVNGFLVEPSSVDQFVSKVIYSINPQNIDEISKIVDNAYEYTRQFEIGQVYASWENLIEDVI